jgi:P4 family phage/plasmid primase-like protien
MTLVASLGKYDAKDPRCNAIITKTWRGDFAAFVAAILKNVPETDNKASAGWVCGAEFTKSHRHGDNFVARHFLSLDYDHITPYDVGQILAGLRALCAFLAYTTWSHRPDNPRLRVWIPLSRGVGREEFEAVSRGFARRGGIELAARESHVPAQFMYRPASKAGVPFQHWEDTAAPYLDVDKVLGEYDDWKERSQWPRRMDERELGPGAGKAEDPREKPGIVGDFCRAFSITAAIERFELPYRPGSVEGRWTYTLGSRADGAVEYDESTKLHSHHDTDPASGQHNAYDLVRLHRFGGLDGFDGDLPLADKASSREMARFAAGLPELAEADFAALGFQDRSAEHVDVCKAGHVSELRAAAHQHSSVGLLPCLPAEIPPSTSVTSDLENARRIQERFGDRLFAVGQAFFTWQKTHWVKDDDPVIRWIAELPQIVAEEAEERSRVGDEGNASQLLKWGAQCNMASTRKTCLVELSRFLSFKADNLNADPGLFNCLSGTIDLRTGQCRPHRAGDFITACTSTGFDPRATAPRFNRFLLEIFRGDETIVAFVKRWFGYCITGETREHALLFHVGEGSNGKGKLVEAISNAIGSYATPGPRQLLALRASGGETASPEITKLLGKRMVTLQETNRDAMFDEGLLKSLTGGDRLTARNLYEGYFDFRPTHKLQLFTNYEPRIQGQDRGIWRRLFFVEYGATFGRPIEIEQGVAEFLQDEQLDEKLAAEAPGILAWLVEGARQWYQDGLNPPAAVLRTTKEYKDRQDVVGRFLADRCELATDGRVPLTKGTASLYGAYTGWAKTNGHGVMHSHKFAREVRKGRPGLRSAQWKEGGIKYDGIEGLRLLEDEA